MVVDAHASVFPDGDVAVIVVTTSASSEPSQELGTWQVLPKCLLNECMTIISSIARSLWQAHGFSDLGTTAGSQAGLGFLCGEGSSHLQLIFPVAKGPLGDLLIKNAV